MVDPSVLELGAGGLLAFMIIREVLNFVAKWKTGQGAGSTQLMIKQVQDLYDWHNINDDDGVKRWYVKQSLEDSVRSVADAITAQNKILLQLTATNDALLKVIEKITD